MLTSRYIVRMQEIASEDNTVLRRVLRKSAFDLTAYRITHHSMDVPRR